MLSQLISDTRLHEANNQYEVVCSREVMSTKYFRTDSKALNIMSHITFCTMSAGPSDLYNSLQQAMRAGYHLIFCSTWALIPLLSGFKRSNHSAQVWGAARDARSAQKSPNLASGPQTQLPCKVESVEPWLNHFLPNLKPWTKITWQQLHANGIERKNWSRQIRLLASQNSLELHRA